jgi:hypothetical protein
MMKEKWEPTLNEIFAEQISMLRPINPARHCGICCGQLYVGFNKTPDGTIQLTKCICSTFGISEYGRIQDHLHDIESNMLGSMQVLHKNLQELATNQEQCTSAIIREQRKMHVATMEVFEILHRNTFWGGIKYRCGVVFLSMHDGYLFLKNGLQQLRRVDDGKSKQEKPKMPGAPNTDTTRFDNMLEMPEQKRDGIKSRCGNATGEKNNGQE